LDHLHFLMPVSRAIVAAQGVFVLLTLGKDVSPPAYRSPPLFTGNRTLDKVLAVFSVAALLLGLPLYGFGGVLPMDNPRTAELSSLARAVSMRRRMVFRKLPEKATPAWIGGRLWWPGCRWRRIAGRNGSCSPSSIRAPGGD
jgi:hypothetical protein